MPTISIRRQTDITRVEWIRSLNRRAELHAARARAIHARHRIRAESIPPSPWTSFAHLRERNLSLGFEPLSKEDAVRLEKEAQQHYSDDALDRKVCVVKDTWVFPASAERLSIDELPIEAMQTVLTRKPWCTQSIMEYYDCADLDERFRGMLLSRRGFDRDTSGHLHVWISKTSLRELRTTSNQLAHACRVEDCKPPRFSIADCFVAGTYEEIDQTTYIERQALSLTQIRGVVKVIYGGPGNMLQSHLLCWHNRDATIASQVPNVVSREHFQQILAGPMTPLQELLLAKRHECSGDRIHATHQVLRQVNPRYATIALNDGFDADRCNGDALCTRLQENDETDELNVSRRRE